MTKPIVHLHENKEPEAAQQEAPQQEESLDLAKEVKELRERVAHLESLAHNEHSLPPETIEHIVKLAQQRAHTHLMKSLSLGKVLLEEQG